MFKSASYTREFTVFPLATLYSYVLGNKMGRCIAKFDVSFSGYIVTFSLLHT